MSEMKIGEKLYNYRKQKGLSQEEVANMIGVSRQIISKWEQDISVPRSDNLKKICEIYDISYEDIFGKDQKEKRKKKVNIILILFLIMVLVELTIILILTLTSRQTEYKCIGTQVYYVLDYYENKDDDNYVYLTIKNSNEVIKTVKVAKVISTHLEKNNYYEFIFRTNEVNTDIDYIFSTNEMINIIEADSFKGNSRQPFTCK